jgi:carboxypeptidase T
MRYLIMRAGILTAPITVALLPLENMTGAGIPVTLPAATLPVYNDTISGNISYTLPAALTNGQRVRFIWRVTTDGISVDDTVTKFYNPVSILYDDMETGVVGTKWTVSSGWNYTTTKAFAGTKSISESPVGNYPASTTRSITYVSAIDLSDATAAYLSFWVRHRSENCRDNLRIQISTNGGGSYTSVCGRHTVSEMDGTLAGQPALTGIRENWTKELVDLNSFKGAGMNNIRLRFLFTSNADDPADDYYKEQDDGFYLDNIRLMKSIVPLVTLPVHFLSFEGKLLADGTAELTWDAEVDNLHDHFEVQKSLDGYNFVTLGTANPNPPYKFIDASVANGRNTYRIKQVDKDGTITYSKLVNIYVDLGKASIVVYPNPVSGVMKVSFNATGGELYTVTLSNLMGKKIHEEKVITGNSAKVIEINLAGKPSQVFMLVVRNARNEIVTTEKIIKH